MKTCLCGRKLPKGNNTFCETCAALPRKNGLPIRTEKKCPECVNGCIFRMKPVNAIGVYGRDQFMLIREKCWRCDGNGVLI
jgi:hypothetical protein